MKLTSAQFVMAGFLAISQFLAIPVRAQTPGVTFYETTASSYNVPNLTRGYVFNVLSPFDISALGVFDDNGDGLFTDHIVSLWDSSGDLLASVDVPAGTGAQLVNQFRYAPITPVSLTLGQNYTVGVYYPNTSANGGFGDGMAVNEPDVFTDPEFSILYYKFAHPGYYDPAPYLNDNQEFGGNFLIIPVPEPSTVSLIGLGAAALLAERRFKRPA